MLCILQRTSPVLGDFPSAGLISDSGLGVQAERVGMAAPTALWFPMKSTTEAPGLKKGLIHIKTFFFQLSFLQEVFLSVCI